MPPCGNPETWEHFRRTSRSVSSRRKKLLVRLVSTFLTSLNNQLSTLNSQLSASLRPGRAQLIRDRLVFLRRELSPWRRSSRRFSSKRGYDVKMRMVNGLAAAEPVILLNSKTGCPQPILLRDRRFLHGRQQVTHLIRLKVQEISRAHPFRDHQHVARHDHLFLRQRHEDQHTIVLEYLGRGRLRALIVDQLRNTICRIVFAFEAGIGARRRKLASGNLLPDERLALQKQERAQSD